MGTPIPMLDLMFFLTETRENPRHVGAILLFERPARARRDVVSDVVAAYRRAKPIAPFNRIPVFHKAGLPEWQEVGSFDMDWHVQHLVLPPPGSDTQLHHLVAGLHAPVLDRTKPGWQAFVIDGLARDRFAIYVKVHHSVVDGESGIELLRRTLSTSAGDRRIRSIASTRLPEPGRKKAARPHGLPRLEGEMETLARTTVSTARGALRLAEEGLSGLRGFSPNEVRPFTAPETPMNEPIQSGRVVEHVVLPLGVMKSIAQSWGTTLNDVVLCVLDAALNRYLRGIDRPAGRPLVAICPVSLHDPDVKKASTLVSFFWTPLGAPAASITRRMQEVMANTRSAKQRIRSLPKEVAYAYSVLTFAFAEVLARVPREPVDYFLPANVLISNVRGPDAPLYLKGARLEAIVPISTLVAGLGLNITLISCSGKVAIGFAANAAALPEISSLARFTRESFARLAEQSRRGRGRRTRAARQGRTMKAARA